MDFIIGGFSATCAGVFSNPFDVIKTRQQLQGELQRRIGAQLPYKGIWQSVKSIVRSDGILGLQKGLGPALMFQFVMNSCRLGFYETVDNTLHWNRVGQNQVHSPILCVFWGGASGVLAATISCPLYLIKVQIQSQSFGEFAVGYQHKHKGTIDGLRTIYREYGVKGLWKGCPAMMQRNAIGSATQLSTFTYCKDFFSQYEAFRNSMILTATASSLISGFCTAVFMTPFDVVATRIFNQGSDKLGRGLLYNGILDCFFKTLKSEGILGLYKGFLPNYCRMAPHTVLNLTFWEHFKKCRKRYLAEKEN